MCSSVWFTRLLELLKTPTAFDQTAYQSMRYVGDPVACYDRDFELLLLGGCLLFDTSSCRSYFLYAWASCSLSIPTSWHVRRGSLIPKTYKLFLDLLPPISSVCLLSPSLVSSATPTPFFPRFTSIPHMTPALLFDTAAFLCMPSPSGGRNAPLLKEK